MRTRTQGWTVVAALFLCLPGFTVPVKAAESADDQRCAALLQVDFSSIEDAPTKLTSAKAVPAEGSSPAHCLVYGYIWPQVGVVIHLPLSGWNGKFLEVGCGGYCGDRDFLAKWCRLDRGYACIASNMGHVSTPWDNLWAYNNWQSEIDHAMRSAHVTALTGKAIVRHFYTRAPNKSYFIGCSTGGRQATVQAQRFPWDFDGIIAGSPSLGVPGLHMSELWGNRAFEPNGQAILQQAHLELIHRAVLAKCDLNDRVRDGLIGDPRACPFDPRELRCKSAPAADCLTDAQIAAVAKIYGGPMTSRNELIYPGQVSKGSELLWMANLRGPDDKLRYIYDFVREEFRYGAFDPDPGPAWQPEQFDFDRDYRRIGIAESLYTAGNPDLRRFKAAGAKLLMFAGWNDVVGMPFSATDYYDLTERTMGGRAATQDFFRLFMSPGVEHCGGGDGAYSVDYLTALENWVEKGRAPDVLLGENLAGEPADTFAGNLFRHPVAFSRPIYPHPLQARYKGRGEARDAASFESFQP